MKTNPLAGRRGLWLRQVSDTSEGAFPAILDTLTAYCGDKLTLCPKVMDGVTWQGQIDARTPLLRLEDVAALKTLCEAQSVLLCPVVVPRGIAGEAEQHAAIAQAAGAVTVDVEYGAGFWDQAPPSQIPAYWQALRAGAPDAYLVSQPDPRNLGDVYTQQSAAFMDGIAAQHYIGWAQVGWTDVLTEVQRFDGIRALGLDTYVTLWGTGNWDLVRLFWRAVCSDALGFQVFAFGNMNGAQLGAIAALQFAAGGDCQQLQEDYDALKQTWLGTQGEVAALQGKIQAAQTALT